MFLINEGFDFEYDSFQVLWETNQEAIGNVGVEVKDAKVGQMKDDGTLN